MNTVQFNFHGKLKERLILKLMRFFKMEYSFEDSEEELDFRKFDEETKNAVSEAHDLILKKDFSQFKSHSELFK